MANATADRTATGRGPRAWVGSLDEIERFSLLLIAVGLCLVAWSLWLDPPTSAGGLARRSAGDWAPGFVVDGILLWVVNGILRRHERTRVLSQVGSLSREFALDAARRARQEGWLTDGSMRRQPLSRASLSSAHLSNAVLAGADLSFSDLREVSLTYADLSGADLTGADLCDADLRWADLTGARVRWADLRGALMDGARLEGIDARFAAVDDRQAREPALAGAVVGGFLDDGEIREVRRTFDLLAEQGTAPVERFYERLFEMAPETRHLFRAEPKHQALKFMQTLRVIVSALHEPNRHVAVLQALGERHGGYGVTPGHYAQVTEAFLAVFAETLGPRFTPAARSAWERAFRLMTLVMTGGDRVTDPTRAGAPGTPSDRGRARNNGSRKRSPRPT